MNSSSSDDSSDDDDEEEGTLQLFFLNDANVKASNGLGHMLMLAGIDPLETEPYKTIRTHKGSKTKHGIAKEIAVVRMNHSCIVKHCCCAIITL